MIDEVDLLGYSGATGGPIVIHAHDDFKVTCLSMIVGDTNSADIESGEAEETPLNSGRWIYTAASIVPQGTTVRIGMAISEHQPGATGLKKAEKRL